MRIVHDYGLVRVVSIGDPFRNTSDIRVETLDRATGTWTLYSGFNSLSDDYAYTNAREAAGRAVRDLAAVIAADIASTEPV